MSQFSFQTDNNYKIQCTFVQNKVNFKVTSNIQSCFQETFSDQKLQKDIRSFIGQTAQQLFDYLKDDPKNLLTFSQQNGSGVLVVKMIVCKKQKKCQLKLTKKEIVNKESPKIQFLSIKRIQDQNQSNPHQQLQNQLAVIDMQIDQYESTIKILQQNSKIKDKSIELHRKENQVLKLKIKNLQLALKSQPQNQKKQSNSQTSIIIANQSGRGKYEQHINEGQHKLKRLFLKSQKINDKEIKEIMKYSWTDIQILSLGDNFISDDGFKTLFQKKQWPFLQKIYLQNNHIKQIDYLQQLPCLQRLSINDNILEHITAVYFTNCCFVSLKHLQISFKKGINNQCWKTLLKYNFQMFPSLERLNYEEKQDVNEQVKAAILKKCNQSNILLNLQDETGLNNLGTLIALIQLLKQK